MSNYGLEEIQHALFAYVLASGNARLASRELEAKIGLKINHDTIRRWATESHKDEYMRLREEHLPAVGAFIADAHMASSVTAMELNAELWRERLENKMAEMPAKELSDITGAARNLATVAGIHSQRGRELAGDYSTPSRGERTADEVLRKLAARGMVVDGEATEDARELPVPVIPSPPIPNSTQSKRTPEKQQGSRKD